MITISLQEVWMCIAKLRKLLKKDDKVEILNIHGEGFRLVANKEAEGFV